MFLCKSDVDVAVRVERAAVETDILLEGLLDELSLVQGRVRFSRHLFAAQKVVALGQRLSNEFVPNPKITAGQRLWQTHRF